MCGIIGVYGGDNDAARLVYTGLWSLQHRGQESSGIASADGRGLRVVKGEGLVAHVYDEEHLALLDGNIAIGHNRYSTSGGSTVAHIQPVTDEDRDLAIVHNGNLPQTLKLESFLDKKQVDYAGRNDSELIFLAIKYYLANGMDLAEAIKKVWRLLTGAFCLAAMTKDRLVAVRDRYGIRPLCLGKFNGQWIVASETCALDTLGAKILGEVQPGEMVVMSRNGLQRQQVMAGKEKVDIFEWVYFARPDSRLQGGLVNEARKNMGRKLAGERKIKGDVVIPVPDSAIPAALGYAEVSGIPFDHGLIKNRYIHRTFIRPAQKLREKDIRMKLNPLAEVVAGKRVIVVDDSIVRGTTSKKLVDMLRQIGAKEVHLVISSPPVKYPDFYGIDTPMQTELIAAGRSNEQIRQWIGADSLQYLSYRGLIEAIGVPEDKLCTACLTGDYPIDIGANKTKIKWQK